MMDRSSFFHPQRKIIKLEQTLLHITYASQVVWECTGDSKPQKWLSKSRKPSWTNPKAKMEKDMMKNKFRASTWTIANVYLDSMNHSVLSYSRSMNSSK